MCEKGKYDWELSPKYISLLFLFFLPFVSAKGKTSILKTLQGMNSSTSQHWLNWDGHSFEFRPRKRQFEPSCTHNTSCTTVRNISQTKLQSWLAFAKENLWKGRAKPTAGTLVVTEANAGQAGRVAVAAGEGLVWVWCWRLPALPPSSFVLEAGWCVARPRGQQLGQTSGGGRCDRRR